MLLQRSSSPSTIFFNSTMHLSMYMRLTTNATIQKALPAHSLITFTTFGYKIKISPSPTLPHLKKNQGKREEIPNKMPNFVGSQ